MGGKHDKKFTKKNGLVLVTENKLAHQLKLKHVQQRYSTCSSVGKEMIQRSTILWSEEIGTVTVTNQKDARAVAQSDRWRSRR